MQPALGRRVARASPRKAGLQSKTHLCKSRILQDGEVRSHLWQRRRNHPNDSFIPHCRLFSDSSLGHSPMATPGRSPHIGISLQNSTYIPTANEALIGGVWQATTAKRDKLMELKAELASTEGPPLDLDSVATDRQILDLWLVDGLKLIAKQSEEPQLSIADGIDRDEKASFLKELSARMEQQVLDCRTEQVNKDQWASLLRALYDELEIAMATLPPDRLLQPVRDYFDATEDVIKSESKWPELRVWVEQQRSIGCTDSIPSLATTFTDAVLRFRLQSTLAAITLLETSWKTFTSVTDQDVDRAAVFHGESVNATTLPTNKLLVVLTAYLNGSGTDRIDALWNLMDKDDDDLLDQVEMNHVCYFAISSSQLTLRHLVQDAVDATSMSDPWAYQTTKPGWRQRRREKKDKIWFTKVFQTTLNRHFEDELEMPNRLRCIYAWANKKHQNNRLDSVLVEEEGGGLVTSVVGRKRYVELHPKISVAEFREVQVIHFPELDRVGQEFLKSLREDLWVHQGKGRQNRELIRDCSVFSRLFV